MVLARRAFPLLLLPLLLTSLAGAQTTWYVDGAQAGPGTGTAGDPFPTIQAALDVSVDEDEVRVAPGEYVENVDYLGKKVRIVSERGAALTHIVPASTSLPTVSGGGRNNTPSTPRSTMIGFTLRDNTDSPAVRTAIGDGIRIERSILRDNAVGYENLYDAWIYNCNFVGNTVAVIHFCGFARVSITDLSSCIFWQNTTNFMGTPDNLEEHLAGACMLDVDPLFYSADDHRIQAGSPAVDTGFPSHFVDPDGSRIDMGVFPFDPSWPLGETYCAPTENSSGMRGLLTVSGSASLSENTLQLTASRAPSGASGIFFYGVEEVYFPLGDGFVCAGGDTARLPSVPTNAGGTATYTVDFTTDQPAHLPPIQPGESRFFQYWYRDVFGAGGGFNFTSSVRVQLTP